MDSYPLTLGKPRDPRRIDRILTKIRNVWAEAPDLRFCQLIDLVVELRCNCQLFHTEDVQFEERLDAFIEKYLEKS